VRRTGSGVFVAINFWDVLCLLVVAAIFEFGLVAISFFFAFRSLLAAAHLMAKKGRILLLSGSVLGTDFIRLLRSDLA